MDKILEHEEDLHDKVQEVLPARLGAGLQLVDVGGEVGRAHHPQHRHHVAHQRHSVPVILEGRKQCFGSGSFFQDTDRQKSGTMKKRLKL